MTIASVFDSPTLRKGLVASAIATTALLGNLTGTAKAEEITITVENLSPNQGLVLTPFWVGFHEGSYDLFALDMPASEGLEIIAEDGDTSVLSEEFLSSDAARTEGVIRGEDGSPLIQPGASASVTVDVDLTSPSSRYFSYASMILPSNDGFIGNGDGLSYPLFDTSDNFIGIEFVVTGAQVWDAGTEVNDESPQSVPLLGDAHFVGPTENGTVMVHPGFIPGGTILQAYPQADFAQMRNMPVARINVALAQP